jgi:hypothetical protein
MNERARKLKVFVPETGDKFVFQILEDGIVKKIESVKQ